MLQKEKMSVDSSSPYKASLTREQFLFYEMRTTAKLMNEDMTEDKIIEHIVADNLFQYPTEKSTRRMAKVCIARLKSMDNETLVSAIAKQPIEVSKQICLYAMMKHSRLVWDFMLMVIGEKYRQQDFSYTKKDINVFFSRLQEQNDDVAAWSEQTIMKLKQVLTKCLIETEMLDSVKDTTLNPIFISAELETGIRENNDLTALAAFNCFR